MKHSKKMIIQKINQNLIYKFKINWSNYFIQNIKNKKMKIKYKFVKIITSKNNLFK